MNTFFNDIKFALRQLRKTPGFTTIVVLTLALGISVSTAMFILIETVMNPPSHFPDPNRIVHVFAKANTHTEDLSYLAFQDLSEQLQPLADLAAMRRRRIVLKKDGWSCEYSGAHVSRNFFSVAQVKAHLGRLFSEEDSTELKQQPSVVLSHRLWRSHFGSDPEMIGQSFIVDGVPRVVLGIAPSWFRSDGDRETSSEFWIPIHVWNEGEAIIVKSMIGRLKPGVTLHTLRTEAEAAFSRLDVRHPRTQAQLKPRIVSDRHIRGFPWNPTERNLLLAITNSVLLVVCLNLSGLLLARVDSRRREMAVRQALGGSWSRLMRQLFTEGMVLATGASGVSLLMACCFMHLLRLPMEFRVRVVGYSLAISLGSTLLFDLLPIWHTCQLDLIPALRADRSRRSRLGRRLFGLPAMVVLQLALSVVLMVCAGHFLCCFFDVTSMDMGFAYRNVLLARDLDTRRDADLFFRDLVTQVRTQAGVEQVGLALHLSTSGGDRKTYRVSLPDNDKQTDRQGQTIQTNIVDSGYFPTLGISMLAGHNFPEQCRPSDTWQVVVSAALASRYWPEQDPIGRFIRLEDSDDSVVPELAQVIGLVPDVTAYPGNTPAPALYVPFGQVTPRTMTLLVKTQGKPERLADPVRRIIHHIDNTVDVFAMTTLADEVNALLADPMVFMLIIESLSLLGLSLACVALYGTIAFTVTRRTYELGIRLALGARGHDVARMVMSQGLKLSLVGLGIGLTGAAVIMRILRSILYDLFSFDPCVYGIASVVILLAAMLATYVPARRAARIDPMEALRYE